MIRAVIDTNLIVSAMISPKGTPAKILKAWFDGRFILVTSPALIDELKRVLSYPKIKKVIGFSTDELKALIDEFGKTKGFVNPKEKLTVIKSDPDDDRLLEAAMEGKAGFIVSGHQHLHELGNYKSIRIVDANAFLKIIK